MAEGLDRLSTRSIGGGRPLRRTSKFTPRELSLQIPNTPETGTRLAPAESEKTNG
jgi:hypothetical protein